jgi:hypothetical protein
MTARFIVMIVYWFTGISLLMILWNLFNDPQGCAALLPEDCNLYFNIVLKIIKYSETHL